MYSIGLQSFMTAKKLKSKQTIDAFLKEQGVTKFTSKNHYQVNNYIENNWLKFASFVDKGLKNGTLSGTPVKLNTYFDEQRQRKETINAEFKSFTKEELNLINLLKKYDCLSQMSKTHSFFNKRGIKLPSRSEDGVSKAMLQLPRIQWIIQHELYSEFVEYLKQLKCM